MTHRFPDDPDYNARMQDAEMQHLAENEAFQTMFAQNYVGLPY